MYPLDTLALKMLNVIREELRDEIERREEKAVRDAQIAAKAERRQKRLDEKAKEMAKVGVRIDEEDVADELDKEEVRVVNTCYYEIVAHCLYVFVALTFIAVAVTAAVVTCDDYLFLNLAYLPLSPSMNPVLL